MKTKNIALPRSADNRRSTDTPIRARSGVIARMGSIRSRAVARLTTIGIRARLLLVYVGIILIAFSGLTLLAGGQINSAVYADYEQHLKDQVRLIAQGIGSATDGADLSQYTVDTRNVLLKPYTPQGESLALLILTPPAASSGQPYPSDHPLDADRGAYAGMPELESALHGQSILVERTNQAGVDTFFTASQIIYNGSLMPGVIQLSIPASALQENVMQRWVVLGIGFILLTSLALIAALLLSQTIIPPLYKLRESAIRLSKGDFSYRVGALTWKDEIAEVAAAFNEMAGQVQRLLEEQRAFASNASHELRTPLTAIRLRTEALRYDSTLTEAAAKSYIEEIDDEAAQLGHLVQDLILLSRFDAGRAERGHDQIDFERLASHLFDQMADRAIEKQIALTLNAPDPPYPVNASLSHLTVVFRNLLDNALKYTSGPGEIIWTMQNTDQAVIHTLRDTGQGIAPEHLPHVYDRFFRADKAHSHDTPGTGLGLALVKSIVNAYDGQITIASDGVGKGTMVTVIWPKEAAKPGTPHL